MDTPRNGITRMQTDLARLNKETVSGRLADVGLTLGAETDRSMRLHIDTAALSALVDSNGTATARLKNTDSALTQMSDSANSFLKTLIASKDSGGNVNSLQQQAMSALSAFIDNANTSDGQNYLFGGINSSVKPLANYDSGPKAAIDAAFTAKFGMAPDDPNVSTIDPASMQDFLDNEFADVFADPSWGVTWSSASDQPIRCRISQSETIDTSVSANQPAMRKLAIAYSMVAGLGTGQLSTEAQQTVIDKAIAILGDAIPDLTAVQAGVGTAQNRVKDASDRLTAQQDILATRIDNLEGVDPSEAKVKIDMLTTQIEMSYSLTSRLLQLSIINYA